MANNLRALSVSAPTNTIVKAIFSDVLVQNIGVNNITVESQTFNVPTPSVLKVRVLGNTLEITTQPLTSLAAYTINFASTDTVIFKSLNGTSVLLEDNVGNKQFFLGPFESSNSVKEYFQNYLNDSVYTTESGSLISNYIDILSSIFSSTLYDVRQIKNENYLSVSITDEPKTRANAAFDHLNGEGAYEITRVGKTTTSATTPFKLSIDEFDLEPISLLRSEFSENLTMGSIDKNGIFNINTFILNLTKRFVIKLKSIIFTYSDGHEPFVYDITKFGYHIIDSKYDNQYAFKYFQLKDNQVKLSDKILEDKTFSSNNIFKIQVVYDYKDSGRVIAIDSVVVNSVLTSSREVLPPLRNVFNFKKAPIVSQNNIIGSIGNVKFVDQNLLSGLSLNHPAFTTEIQFRFDFAPSSPGEYAIDYNTGTVYVFGANSANDGTGATPPLASYSYRLDLKENIDWVFDDSTSDLAALPTGSLIGLNATIGFNYEQVLAKDIDYKSLIHSEVLDERIGNNLLALNAIGLVNTPITNVFRIFNETSGEIYKPTRWNNNKVFFIYNKPPKIEEILNERVSFESIDNEVMFVDTVDALSTSLQIFNISLNNDNVISKSEDCIGCSFNSSVSLSDNNIFATELYFDNLQSIAANKARLTGVGQYMLDYVNGVLYVVVSISNDFNIGSISYKRGYIKTANQHITSVADIYYRINSLEAKDKHFNYINFDDGSVLPNTFDIANEAGITGETSIAPYLLFSNEIGIIVDSEFNNSIANNIRFLRAIYENDDLINNSNPINFVAASTFNNKTIVVNSLTHQEYHSVEYSMSNHIVILNTGLNYLSNNITLNISVKRLSDSVELWNGSGQILLGESIQLILPGIHSPQTNDSVLVTYSYTINDLSHVVVDYNKGEYYIDYNALTDEIIVSYEYGNNALDFRESTALASGEQYFVSYKVGALRDALFKNFGSLIDIGVLNNFDTTFGRERYRDAITAAMHAFARGPTPDAIKSLATTISHVPSEINESIFENWSLGNSLLNPKQFKISDNALLAPGKNSSGIVVDSNQTIRLPVISNVRLEQGTFETWIKPSWEGLDNLSDLSFGVTKDGYQLSDLEVFIGAGEYHPTWKTDAKTGKKIFGINKYANVSGIPNKNKDGLYIYYNSDPTMLFNRWFVELLDGYGNDGYVDGYVSKKYKVDISTNGRFYDVKPLSSGVGHITSGTNLLSFSVTSIFPNEGITFVADKPHYIMDFGEDESKNRMSLFKDESGYLNFRIYDKFHYPYTISADVSDWKHDELHHVSTSWKLNTAICRDELHLFIDGFEVPNIIKYGENISPYLHEKFRTVSQEEVIGNISKNIIAGNDLTTVISSNQVASSINFSQYGIEVGDTLYIEENGFDVNGYNITNVNGNTLTLNVSMPSTISDCKFNVNKQSFNIISEIDIYPNIAISLLHSFVDGYDLQTTIGSNEITSAATNFITSQLQVGDLIKIHNGNFPYHYTVLSIGNHSITINNTLTVNATGLQFSTYHNVEEEIPGIRALNPAYQISKSNYDNDINVNILTVRDKAKVNDLVLIRTLGINHRRIRRKYYVWGNTTNILKTKLPSPIALDDVKIYKIILDPLLVGPSNASLVSGIFISQNIITEQPSSSQSGRTLSVSITGDNIDFSVATTVAITGSVIDSSGNATTITETITFNARGTKDTSHLFGSVDHINVHCKPIRTAANSAVVAIKEKYVFTKLENTIMFINSEPEDIPKAIIRYSYQVGVGDALNTIDGYHVADSTNFFSSSMVGAYLVISSPAPAVGTYKISAVSNDHTTLTLNSGSLPLPTFTDGYYQILNATDYRSGLQNGYLTFEYQSSLGTPYPLIQGSYELDYYTYLSVPFDLPNSDMFIGSNFNGTNQLNGNIDEIQVLNIKLTDTRIGESVAKTQRSITKDFNALKEIVADSTTLVLAHCDTLPLTNDADIYKFAEKNIFQSGNVINDNFSQSICLLQKPLVIDNYGILDTKKEATIEFWINPIFDSNNDPNYRFYLDASGLVSEHITSDNNTTITLLGSASAVSFVKLDSNNQNIDYFAGGTITNNGKTLVLHKELPNQNTKIIVSYLPKGLKGDRVSIFKDLGGYLNFTIIADGINYTVRAPTHWARNTWHRIKASYKINSGTTLDEMHLLVDGYERNDILYGSGLLFGQGLLYGSSLAGPNTRRQKIKFTDSINQLFIGSDVNSNNQAFCLIDNFRISNIFRPLYQPFGEPMDPNYSSNLDMVFPITEDLYTTLLLNFDKLVEKNTDFAILNSRSSGLADFSLTVLDSFGIINDNNKVKQVLETLVASFKPANSRVFIKYS